LRETLKSLSIFSAMLLLLLLISSGCDVNIPGCGKRSLPFFKKIAPPPVPTVAPAPPPVTAPAASSPTTAALPPAPVVEKAPAKSVTLETSTEMTITKQKAVPTITFTATATSTPLEMEKIAYTTLEDNKPSLWMMNNDGTERTRITPPGTSNWFPLWSPNGKVLAFLSDMNEGKINLYTVKKGTKEFIQITFFSDMTLYNPAALKPPFSWSPRSDEIAYLYHNQVWKVDLTTLAQLTMSTLDALQSAAAVEWAPHRDNKFIAYMADKGVNFTSLILVNPRLLDQLKLVEAVNNISDLTWSPDARKLAYISNRNNIFTASPETSLPRVQIYGASPEFAPFLSYSPVESNNPPLMVLAKKSKDDKGFRVALVDKPSKEIPDSGSLKFLTQPDVTNAVWSPDGNKIAYVQNGELWVMDSLTGSNKTRLAATGIISPNWSKK
jgi:dipeptidyl aminopeptidase/acylaminoacyl peptidase